MSCRLMRQSRVEPTAAPHISGSHLRSVDANPVRAGSNYFTIFAIDYVGRGPSTCPIGEQTPIDEPYRRFSYSLM